MRVISYWSVVFRQKISVVRFSVEERSMYPNANDSSEIRSKAIALGVFRIGLKRFGK